MSVRGCRRLAFRAIRGAWAVARARGLADGSFTCVMSKDATVRMAMVAAWKAGYRNGRTDGRRDAERKS